MKLTGRKTTPFMAVVRDRIGSEDRLAQGYEALAASRSEADRQTQAGMRRNVARLGRQD